MSYIKLVVTDTVKAWNKGEGIRIKKDNENYPTELFPSDITIGKETILIHFGNCKPLIYSFEEIRKFERFSI